MGKAGIIIAGAGPCGIGAAWTLSHESPGQPFLLIDENTRGGGCAASELTPDGFTFDFGGHVLFPHHYFAEFGRILRELVNEWSSSCPARYIYMHGRLIPSPIQRNIHRLPAGESVPILLNLLSDRLIQTLRPKKPEVACKAEESLRDFLRVSFGRELSKRVMEPLNQKMWATHPSDLSSVWVRHRSGSQLSNVPQVGLGRLIRQFVLRTDDPQWTADTTVDYPATGGTGSIWSKALERVGPEKLRFGKRITAIRTLEKSVVLSDNSVVPYSKLISTIPLDTLLDLCLDMPQLRQLGRGLRRSSALLFGFGIKGSVPTKYQGIHSFHCPQPDLPFWRVTIPSNVSPGNVPDKALYYSVMCEASCEANEYLSVDAQWRHAVIDGLVQIGLVTDASRVVSRFEKTLPHGYPLPFLGRDELLRTIHQVLEPLGIVSRGRFGGWRYEVSNQDYAFMQGVEAVRFLLMGIPEETYMRKV
jgi:protoporphyrinogen oxidase